LRAGEKEAHDTEKGREKEKKIRGKNKNFFQTCKFLWRKKTIDKVGLNNIFVKERNRLKYNKIKDRVLSLIKIKTNGVRYKI
jgi:hypothetical protein